MKKAFIPAGIAVAFGVFGLVFSITGLNFAGGAAAGLELESAGGTDAEVKNVNDTIEALKSPALRNSAYYSALIGQDKDPEPTEGKTNSIGVVCTGSGYMSGTEFNRTLTIAENEKGFVYQYVGVETKDNVTTERNYLTAVSRHGMFVKFNKFNTNAEPGTTGKYLEDAIAQRTGKWYYVGIYESRGTPTDPMDAMILGMCQSTAAQYSSMFFGNVDTNNSTLAQIANQIDNKKSVLTEEPKDTYTGDFDSNYKIKVDLTDSVQPTINLTYKGDRAKNYEEEELYIAHIDNCKVEIVENGVGDFYDLFSSVFRNYMNDMMGGQK